MIGWIEPEPELSFGRGFRHVDPRAGLSLYGPFVAEGQKEVSLGTINLGIIGSRYAVSLVESWLEEIRHLVPADSHDSILFPSYPGFKEVFHAAIQVPSALRQIIPDNEISRVAGISDRRRSVEEAANMYLSRLNQYESLEPRASVVVCAIPKEVEDNCWSSSPFIPTPEEKKTQRRQKKMRKKGQLFLTDFDEEIFPVVTAPSRGTNLRARIKAGAMKVNIPTQLILESTLSSEKSIQPKGTVAWNLSVGLFYKAGGYPWRLAQVHENACFVGVSFYRERNWDPVTMGTAIAQIFDSSGEGLIIKGAKVEWDPREDRSSPHLGEGAASSLVRQVLEAYRLRRRGLPDRIVFHKTSRFWPEELTGMRKSVPNSVGVDFVSIERGDLRLVREGNYPPLRGTCVALGQREFLVYGIGFIPYLNTYPGPHVPSPLHILEHHGDATPQQICSEILSLTKLNWNTSQFCCGVPITLNIARRVSSVLAELPEGETINPSYRFYM